MVNWNLGVIVKICRSKIVQYSYAIKEPFTITMLIRNLINVNLINANTINVNTINV